MTKIILFCAILTIISSASDGNTVEVASKEQLEHVLGKKAKVVDAIYGDLNGDGRKDMAVVVEGTNQKKIKQNPDFPDDGKFNFNKRGIMVMFQDKQGLYRLEPSSLNNRLIPSETFMENPNFIVEHMIRIEKNQLIVSFSTMMSMGGWGATSSEFRFRYQGGKFVLIGLERLEWSRNTGIGSKDSYNYLTRTHKHTSDIIMIETQDTEDLKPKTTFKKIKNKTLVPLSKMGCFNDFLLGE